MHSWHRILVCLAILAAAADARADGWQKLRARGAEVYYADADLRAAFAQAAPEKLPEARRKLPKTPPAAFDWTTVVKHARVHAQGASICCWAYSALAAFEWSWAIRNGASPPPLALQPILDRVQRDGAGYNGWALQDLLEHGTCEARAYPHLGKPSQLREGVRMPYRAIAWGLVAPQGGVPAVGQIKQALLDHGPLATCIYQTPAFKAYKGGVFAEHFRPPTGESQTNHFVVIVGWDDRKGRGGCWKVQNSHGRMWGEGGFMWIEYGSNNVGHSACWVRAQATQYQLPADIHEQVSAAAEPFPRWPGAKALSPPPPELPTLTPDEALKQQGERVVVRFKVLGGGIHDSDGHVELFSKASWRQEGCLIVRLLKDDLPKFGAPNPQALLERYKGQVIRVRGSVQINPIYVGDRPIIEVGAPDQIEVVK
jgi:hypothetical protein